MILEVMAKHFNGTDYGDTCDCALSKAAKEQFGTDSVEEFVSTIEIDGEMFHHKWYDVQTFIEDMEKAKAAGFDETVIRTLELVLIQEEED